MKPEALDALTTQTMRPKALDAVAAQQEGEKSSDTKSPARQQTQVTEEPDATSMTSNSSAPASDGPVATTDGTTEGTPTILPTTTIVSEVAQTVRSAVHTVIAWAETKAESLSAEEDTTGPYTSPATCMPSDLDVIASGILPALPTTRQYDGGVDVDEKKEVKGTEKSTTTRDVESEKNREEQDHGTEPKS